MVSIGTAIALVSLARSVSQDAAQDEQIKQVRKEMQDRHGSDAPPASPSEAEMKTADKLDQLVELQRKSNPDPQSVDSFYGDSFDLNAGDVVVVEISPRRGYDLRVQRVEFDRRDSHNYEISVDGEDLSTVHKAEFHPTRNVTHNGKVVAEVENASGSGSTVDFEIEAWAVPSEAN